jgi:hypothetical protein
MVREAKKNLEAPKTAKDVDTVGIEPTTTHKLDFNRAKRVSYP